MRTRFRTILLGLVMVSCASAAIGSGASGYGVPSFIDYRNDGIVYVYFPNSIRSGTIPACAANIGGSYYKLVLDSSTVGGKAMLAGLIAAHAAGEGVAPFGTGDCGIDGNTESLHDFGTQ